MRDKIEKILTKTGYDSLVHPNLTYKNFDSKVGELLALFQQEKEKLIEEIERKFNLGDTYMDIEPKELQNYLDELKESKDE